MRVCVVGAGAIGGLIAVRLALAGEDVCVVERGAHLVAIQRNGLKLRWQDGTLYSCHPPAFEAASKAGEQDLVVLAVKTYDLEIAAQQIRPLLGPHTSVLTVQNGIPWWYFQKEGGRFDGMRLASVDPSGMLSDSIDVNRIIGCVVHPASTLAAPGIVHHIGGSSFPLGELDGRETQRVSLISQIFEKSGLKARVIPDIRAEIWLKALGALSFNPISALCRASMAEIYEFPHTRALAATMMAEAQAIAAALGVALRHTIEKRLEGAGSMGAHKTSMLQDLETGHPLETDALLGAIVEIAQLTGTPSPSIASVYALIKLLENTSQSQLDILETAASLDHRSVKQEWARA
jgi:ketopantoate reductase